MNNKPIHVVYRPNTKNWAVEKEKTKIALALLKKKAQAEDFGKEVAKKDKVEFIVHNIDGKIAKKNSFGNDPCPPKDKD